MVNNDGHLKEDLLVLEDEVAPTEEMVLSAISMLTHNIDIILVPRWHTRPGLSYQRRKEYHLS